MAGKHKGPSRKGKTLNRMSRITLDKQTEREFLKLVKQEQRSMANMLTVLVTEALQARRK